MLAAAVLALAASVQGPAIQRQEGPLEKVLQAAGEADRPVLVESVRATAPGWPWMEKAVLSDPEVAEFANGNLLVLRVEEGKGDHEALAKRYSLRDFPTFLLLDAEGNELERQAGVVGKSYFLEMLKDVCEGIHVRGLRRRVEQRPDDPVLRARLGRRLFLHGDPGATVHLERALELDPKKEKESTVEAAFLLEVRASIPAGTVPSLRAYLAKYPDSGAALDVHRALVRELARRKDTLGSIESLEVLLLRAPDAEIRNSMAWSLATNGRDLERALALVEEALKEHAESPAFMDTKAECLSRLGRHDEAIELEKRAIALLDPSMPAADRTEYYDRLKEMEKRRDAAGK